MALAISSSSKGSFVIGDPTIVMSPIYVEKWYNTGYESGTISLDEDNTNKAVFLDIGELIVNIHHSGKDTEFCSDSGVIGVIPAEYCKKQKEMEAEDGVFTCDVRTMYVEDRSEDDFNIDIRVYCSGFILNITREEYDY